MKGTFIESSYFTTQREKYLDDSAYVALQMILLSEPKKGDVIQGTGGIRKIRIALRRKGKRGGARVIYYYFAQYNQFYLLTIYSKNEVSDLTRIERNQLRRLIESWKNEQT